MVRKLVVPGASASRVTSVMPWIPERPHPEPQQIAVPEVNLLVVRHEQVTLDGLPALYDAAFTALGTAAEQGVFVPVGPALGVYTGDPRGVFDLEIGFPVGAAIPGPLTLGDLTAVPSVLPAGTGYVASHVGGYEGMGQAWSELMTFVQAHTEADPIRTVEAYVTEPYPGMDTAHLRTDLIYLVA